MIRNKIRCSLALPTVFTDELSFYELVCKLNKFAEKMQEALIATNEKVDNIVQEGFSITYDAATRGIYISTGGNSGE